MSKSTTVKITLGHIATIRAYTAINPTNGVIVRHKGELIGIFAEDCNDEKFLRSCTMHRTTLQQIEEIITRKHTLQVIGQKMGLSYGSWCETLKCGPVYNGDQLSYRIDSKTESKTFSMDSETVFQDIEEYLDNILSYTEFIMSV